jgi:nucleotide-binding universal stress UspA family protein
MITVFSRIAVAYDHSYLGQKALETAMKLVKQDTRIELDVITVVHYSPTADMFSTYAAPKALRQDLLASTKRIMDEVKEKLNGLPNRTRTIILEGDPASMIIEFVKQNNSDLLVMGSRGLSGMKEVFLGSVSHHVVQKSPCPIYIVK